MMKHRDHFKVFTGVSVEMFRLIASIFLVAQVARCDLIFSPQSIETVIQENATFTAFFDENTNSEYEVNLYVEGNIVRVSEKSFELSKDQKKTIAVIGQNAGHVIITGNTSSSSVKATEAFVRVTVGKSWTWVIISDIVGWVYFAAWSISFYPQMYENWKRKSVVGLNFDFLALNFLGFFLYSLFNIGLYAFEPIKKSYHNRYPHSTNPVQVNDIVFSVHAFAAVAATLVQCYFYERENQKVSKFAKGLFGIYGVFLGISLILSFTNVIEFLDFLYYCSYVKLSITLIKYIPQAYMNYQRKSTVGWSIGNIFLDFTGGILSMLQMIINSHNYNDWESIFGDPTKFGLGLFSVLFDIFFILQHYVFYRHKEEVV